MTKKPTGPKVSRSETVSIRLDPKVRFLAELAAQGNHRTLSSFIEWCVRHILSNGIPVTEQVGAPMPRTTWGDDLWHPDELIRFVRLASKYPDLLTKQQIKLWMYVQQDDRYWQGHMGRPRPVIFDTGFEFELLEKEWSELCKQAAAAEPRNFMDEVRAAYNEEDKRDGFPINPDYLFADQGKKKGKL